jgi:hypothetical protein
LRKRHERGSLSARALQAWIGALLALLLGCDNSGAEGGVASATSVSATAAVASAAASGEDVGRGTGRGGGKRGKREARLAYVDGKVVGVLNYPELPPSFGPTILHRPTPSVLFNIAAYYETQGVDIDKVRALHLVGGGRTAAISGDEFRRFKDQLFFRFSKRYSGRPVMDWPDTRVDSTTRIDGVTAFQVFVEKEPPTWVKKERAFRFADGRVVEGIPYAEEQASAYRGTRVYVDGKLIDALRRRDLGELDGARIDDGSNRFRLKSYLEDLGVDTAKVKAADFVSGDRLVGRLDADAWRASIDELTFRALKEGRGRMTMKMPSRATPTPGRVVVHAIVLYAAAAVPEREIRKPARRPD